MHQAMRPGLFTKKPPFFADALSLQGALQQRTAQQHLKSSVQALIKVGQLLWVLGLVIAACRGDFLGLQS